MPPVTVRRATAADCPAIADVYAHYVTTSVATFDTEARSTDGWIAKLDDVRRAGRPFLVAVDGERVLGFSYLSAFRDRAAYAHTCEHTVYVAPGLERRGVGSALVAAMLDAAADTDVREILALIALPGDGSIALHQRHGFVEAGVLRRVGFKFDRWIDVAILQYSLGRVAPALFNQMVDKQTSPWNGY
ncbi:MAG: GNAT family N-acetyltransferase [Gordonia sp. (in: high G+C Gram-positive bacteria)]|uniref:GNAT family N-acetyltransferase n=1 Tax=Gordonia sp. (in: high G+C Gram-positive bacteria) TaxID=84139 RepID=UPI0039E37198